MIIYYNEGLETEAKFMDEEETKIKICRLTCIKILGMSLNDTRN